LHTEIETEVEIALIKFTFKPCVVETGGASFSLNFNDKTANDSIKDTSDEFGHWIAHIEDSLRAVT
jgi:hypothetical protein